MGVSSSMKHSMWHVSMELAGRIENRTIIPNGSMLEAFILTVGILAGRQTGRQASKQEGKQASEQADGQESLWMWEERMSEIENREINKERERESEKILGSDRELEQQQQQQEQHRQQQLRGQLQFGMTMQVPHPMSNPSVAPTLDRYQTELLRLLSNCLRGLAQNVYPCSKKKKMLIFIPVLDSTKLEFITSYP
ncbi:hypothetical protein M0804_001002 [Polistes exclamans]|nr:hypothetical protein M0804_001002 [Polistes exclamans]